MEFDKSNNPFLRLPPPHSNIILAMGRDSDGPALISMLNHPSVYMNLAGPPFPYTQAHRDAHLKESSSGIEMTLAEFREVEASRGQPNGRKWVRGVPFTVIREIDPQTGEDTVVGDFYIRRNGFIEIENEEERKKMKAQNDGLEVGDPNIVWETGFSLVPTVHGRGIMTAVLGTLMEKWLIPYMNVHHMSGGYLDHNIASKRVFEKNGWVFDHFQPDRIELPEIMTGVKGKKFGMGVVRWDRA